MLMLPVWGLLDLPWSILKRKAILDASAEI
jgi:hypothetical protein